MKIELKAVSGMDEALAFLKELNTDKTRRLLNPSLREAAKPVVQVAQQMAPIAKKRIIEWWGKKRKINPGLMKKNIGIITPRKQSKHVGYVFVGPLSKRRKTEHVNQENTSDPWYRHFVIHGTRGYTVKKGKMRGRFITGQQPNPFMDRALSSAGNAFRAKLEQSIVRRVNLYAKKKLRA